MTTTRYKRYKRYTCDMCGLYFESDREEDAAVTEFERDYGMEFDPEAVAVICHACYQKVKLWEASL